MDTHTLRYFALNCFFLGDDPLSTDLLNILRKAPDYEAWSKQGFEIPWGNILLLNQ